MIKPAVPKFSACAVFTRYPFSPYRSYRYALPVPEVKHVAVPSTTASTTNSTSDRLTKATSNKLLAPSSNTCARISDFRYPILSVINPVGISPRKITPDNNACRRKNMCSDTPACVLTSNATGAKKTSPFKKQTPS